MPTSPSRRPPATLLSITGLRQALDYGDPHLPRCSAFYDDVRAFRKKFVTSNGKLGPSLYDWRDRDHQDGLKEMTDAYLNRDRNGPLFWPDDPAAPNYNKLQYTRDQRKIENDVRQLFFRMNQQQYRNFKYKTKAKAKAHPTDPTSPQEGTPDNPINLEHAPTPDASIPPSPVIPVKEEISQASHVYEVPQSPHPSPPTTTQSRFEPAPTTPQKHSAAPTASSSPNRPAKRPKVLRKTPAKSGGRFGAKRDIPATTPRRTSARPKVQRGVTDYATEEEFVAALASPEPQEDTRAVSEEEADRSIKVVSVSGSTFTSRRSRSPHAPEQHVTPSIHHSPSLPPGTVAASSSLPAPDPPSGPKKISRMMQFDRDPPTHLPTPSTDTPDIISNNPRKSETVDSFKSLAAGARPRIDFLYRVVRSRQPVYSYRKWAPSRKLEEMTLGEFTDELRLQGDVRALVFTVEGPGLCAVEEIARGDELSFDSLRRQIKKVIRGQLTGRAADAPLIFEMEIEPVRGESTGGEDEVDDADFVI